MKKIRTNQWAGFGLGVCAAAVLTACGGSGGGSSSTTTPPPAAVYVTGTAAAGAPIASATVTLKDAAGASATATTGSDGSFQVVVTTLTAPFLLSVPSGSETLYSYAGSGGATADLTPYTSVVLQAYYTALGSNVAATFNGTLSAAGFPASAQLSLLENPFLTLLQPYLNNASVASAGSFDFFTSTFTANHTGFDQVLDRTSMDSSLLSLTVDDGSGSTAGTLSSSISVAVTAGSGATPAQVAVHSSTADAGSGTTSSAQQTVPVGTSSGQQTDLANAETGVTSLFNNLIALAQSKGSNLGTSDVSAYIDSSYLDNGVDATQFAAQVAASLQNFASGTTTVSIYRLSSFTDTSSTDQLLTATVLIANTPTGGAQTLNYLDDSDDTDYGMVYKLESDGSWKFYGHQTQVNAHVQLQESRRYTTNGTGTSNSGLQMFAQVSPPVGTLIGASISGPANSLPDCAIVNPSPMTESSVTLVQDAGTFENGSEDRFDLPCQSASTSTTVSNPPAAGTQYTFILTPADHSSFTQTWSLNSATDDIGSLTTINGTAQATFAGATSSTDVAGTTLTLAYTPPTTFSVLYSYISAFCQNADEFSSSSGGTDLNGTLGSIPPGTNTGTIAIPATCDGAAVGYVELNVWFYGVNGEISLLDQPLLPGS
jgi:glucoamylase